MSNTFPKFEIDNLSHEKLVGLLKLYIKLYAALDGFWYLLVKKRVSNDEALACDIAVWEKLCKYEMSRITQFMNIQGKSAVDVLNAMQLTPWFQNLESQVKAESPNRAILTVNHCPTLAALEKEGEGRENQICKIVEPFIFRTYANFFDPALDIRCIKSPPRENKNGVCCIWEFSNNNG